MRRLFVALLAVAMSVFGLSAAATATTAEKSGAAARTRVAGPLDLSGELQGAPYEIRVPADWNGTLVVYAHGYRDKADHEGEVDDRSADAFVGDDFEAVMLDAGYALAGSAYRDNGWAVEEGIFDSKRLAAYFISRVGRPDTTILVGLSMGSVITFESVDHRTGLYDGAIPSCAVGAGAPRAFDGTLALASAYDAVFGWPAAWGTPADVRDDIDFDTEVAPVLFSQLSAPGGLAKFEFIRLVAGIPLGPEWPFNIAFFATEGRAELERRAGGPVAQNLDHTYVVSTADRAYLASIGVDGATVDGYLTTMDANRYAAPAASRSYVERYADYSGILHRPVLTLHTAVDALVPPANIAAYTETVNAAGSGDMLASAFTDGVGHCNFTPQQMLTAVNSMQGWIDTGVAPDSFPAAEGFIDFTPPPWPQP